MLNCENCINGEYKNKFFSCLVTQLGEARTELLKQIPIIGKEIKEYECAWYLPKGE